jgi:hypothetical protein
VAERSQRAHQRSVRGGGGGGGGGAPPPPPPPPPLGQPTSRKEEVGFSNIFI